jgi:opacity protein-like surface antigen
LTPNTLLYVTGGWSWSQFLYSLTSNVGLAETATLNLAGPQVGFGVETQLGGGWNARLEYLEAFYANGSFNPFPSNSFISSDFNTNPTINLKPAVGVGRFALIYRFGADNAAAWPTPSATPSWNGPTIAATVAAVSATAKVDSAQEPGNYIDGFGGSAILPTVLLGYNWRIAPRWVFGIDGGAAPGIATTQIHIDWTEAAHARFGYLLTPATMLYASVGWFQSGFNGTQLFANKAMVPPQRVNALEIGAGVETALDEHWGVRFEYQYGFIQTINNVVDLQLINPNRFTLPLTVALHPQVQSAQVGLVYRFN